MGNTMRKQETAQNYSNSWKQQAIYQLNLIKAPNNWLNLLYPILIILWTRAIIKTVRHVPQFQYVLYS